MSEPEKAGGALKKRQGTGASGRHPSPPTGARARSGPRGGGQGLVHTASAGWEEDVDAGGTCASGLDTQVLPTPGFIILLPGWKEGYVAFGLHYGNRMMFHLDTQLLPAR